MVEVPVNVEAQRAWPEVVTWGDPAFPEEMLDGH
jgi:hypothetical protein